jgi:hypothetical protein
MENNIIEKRNQLLEEVIDLNINHNKLIRLLKESDKKIEDKLILERLDELSEKIDTLFKRM